MNNLSTSIATTREQSERLLAMKVNPETADMHYCEMPTIATLTDEVCNGINHDEIESILFSDRGRLSDVPAWSLPRLISMMPKCIVSEDCDCYLHITYHEGGVSVYYDADWEEQISFFLSGADILSLCIDMIEWLIKNNYLDKEYLKLTSKKSPQTPCSNQ